MALVKEYQDGSCKVYIYDDCLVTNPVERQKIFDRIAEIYINDIFPKKIKEVKREKIWVNNFDGGLQK